MSGAFILKRFDVAVEGYSVQPYYAASRGRAMAEAWRSYASVYDVTFGEFLKRARAWRASGREDPRLGEPITVAGAPAFWVGCNRQYIQFVRPDSDVILNSHPYDVEPPEARRGTPYYVAHMAADTVETGACGG